MFWFWLVGIEFGLLLFVVECVVIGVVCVGGGWKVIGWDLVNVRGCLCLLLFL